MTTSTVVFLALLWAGVLVPGAWRDRRSSPRSTVDGFHAAMERLATCDSRSVMVPGGGRRVVVHPAPSRRSTLLARRRAMLLRMAGVVGATFLTGLLGGGAWWVMFAIAALAFVGYLAALRSLAVARLRARQVVPLHTTRPEPVAEAVPTPAVAASAVDAPALAADRPSWLMDAPDEGMPLFAAVAGDRR